MPASVFLAGVFVATEKGNPKPINMAEINRKRYKWPRNSHHQQNTKAGFSGSSLLVAWHTYPKLPRKSFPWNQPLHVPVFCKLSVHVQLLVHGPFLHLLFFLVLGGPHLQQRRLLRASPKITWLEVSKGRGVGAPNARKTQQQKNKYAKTVITETISKQQQRYRKAGDMGSSLLAAWHAFLLLEPALAF